MYRFFLRSAATALSVLCLTALVSAGGARFWEVATLADFLEGDVTNLSIDQHGRLTLGPELTAIADANLPYLWSAVPQAGGALLLGSGNEGQVIRIAADGTRTVFYDSAELEAHALAAAPKGGFYVGTSPDGRIYHVDNSGKARTFFDPEDKYVWALVVGEDGEVYAATGDRGRIYRISEDGNGEVFYDTSATNVRALALAPDGTLLAGTESPGRVFRIDREGRGFLLLDSGMPEISALRLGSDGIAYAAAVSAQPSGGEPAAPSTSPEPTRAPIPSVSTEITVISIMDVTAATGRTAAGGGRETARSSGRGVVFRIRPDGVWDQVWSSGEDAPYDVITEPDGALLIATGAKGKVYRVAGEPATTTLVTRVPARQVTAILRDESGELLLASANPGKVFRLGSTPAARGAYESDVLDSESVSTWGAISWRGQAPRGTSVRLFTRSGNTAAPDKTWSPWSDPYDQREGQQVTSPKARYLQWKIEVVGASKASPVVTSVTVAYLQRNRRPDITSITVHPPGVVFQKPFSTGETEIAGYDADPLDRRLAGFGAGGASGANGANTPVPVLGRRGYQKGLQTFIWKAEDANDDDLTYELSYRREGETSWKPLERELNEPLFVWDTTSVPNGTYVIKVAASDSAANPPGEALTAEQESGAFDIDNTPPVLEIAEVTRRDRRTIVRFTVMDDDSPVQHVEYSLDANGWRPIYPRDGIADSRREEFELALDADAAEKAIILRAMDTLNNVATTRAEAPAR